VIRATVHHSALGVVVSFGGAARNRLHRTTSKGEHTMGRGRDVLPFLVKHSAGEFRLTEAGRKVLGYGKASAGKKVRPGSITAIRLEEEGVGKGRLPKTLIEANAKEWPISRRPEPRDAEADDRPYVCTVCLAPVGPGGRKTAPAKCARCYQRERRKLPEAPRSSSEPRDQSVTVQLTKSAREQLERFAEKMKITLSTLISRIVTGEIRVDVRRPV